MEDFDYEFAKLEVEEKMELALKGYQINLSRISAGRANPKILDHLNVEYFGSLMPLTQIANIAVPEPRQLLIKPYDISSTKNIVGTINSASLGINAIDEGDKIRINFPELTTERRKELVKSLNNFTEQARVKVRAARQQINKELKVANLPEDINKNYLQEIQSLTDDYIEKINKMTKEKEQELMTI